MAQESQTTYEFYNEHVEAHLEGQDKHYSPLK